MPIYEYSCKKCKARFEIMQKVSDPPKHKCPQCGGSLIKIISVPALQFKGNGFYITDYARKSAPEKGEKPKEKPQGEKKADSKPETASSSSNK
jgi:putative FmdB family regulatory protein